MDTHKMTSLCNSLPGELVKTKNKTKKNRNKKQDQFHSALTPMGLILRSMNTF